MKSLAIHFRNRLATHQLVSAWLEGGDNLNVLQLLLSSFLMNYFVKFYFVKFFGTACYWSLNEYCLKKIKKYYQTKIDSTAKAATSWICEPNDLELQ